MGVVAYAAIFLAVERLVSPGDLWFLVELGAEEDRPEGPRCRPPGWL